MISQDERIRSEVLEAAARLGEREVTCYVSMGDIILEGPVSSDEHAYQLEEAAGVVPGVRSVQNSLEVEGFVASIENEIEGIDLTPDFTARTGTDDYLEAVSEAEPYFPPTDPVIGTSGPQNNNAEILNGFAPSGEIGPLEDEQATARGDEELLAAIEEALRLDAGTADLDIEVMVSEGVVVLRGEVRSLYDAELAESVVSDVPGVEEVQEELRIEGM